MKRIILSGCNGTMGKVLTKTINAREDCTVVAGFDKSGECLDKFPVFSNMEDCGIKADAIIDFSHPDNIKSLVAYAVRTKTPLVVATTGLTEEQQNILKEASEEIAVFFTANMSIGVNLMVELAKKAASVLQKDFDIEIIEKHHNKKIDAPSGTALMLADGIFEVMEDKPKYVYDRHSKREARSKAEIGIHSVRGGTIVGEHEVIFAGRDEVLSITHSAMSKEIFATGAINAALFVCKSSKGMYNMSCLL